jgi:2OG-Fe(II) oxygenase superfamily
VTGLVTATLYNLLIYDKGSFFVSHRDTEKAPGMIATLVLTLPSQPEGGELVVRHKDQASVSRSSATRRPKLLLRPSVRRDDGGGLFSPT